jgi:hypothetical protein
MPGKGERRDNVRVASPRTAEQFTTPSRRPLKNLRTSWARGNGMRLRIGLALSVIALAVTFAFVPFNSGLVGYKGIGSGSLSCRARIFIGWTGGHPESHVAGGTGYDSSQQCGYDARNRLIIVGLIAGVGFLGLSMTLAHGARHGYPEESWW